MPTTFVKGDFIAEAPARGKRGFGCPVDQSGQLDKGVAVAVAKQWPAFATWWSERCSKSAAQAGDAAAWSEGNDVIYALVVHRRGAKAKLSWLERATQGMLEDAATRKLEKIHVPRPWGGSSGLDGLRAKRVLEEIAMSAPVELVVFEQFIRAGAATKAAPVEAEEEPELADEEEEEEEIEEEAEAEEAPETEPSLQPSARAKKRAGMTKSAANKKKKSAATKKAAPKKKAATPKKAATKKKNRPGG